MLESTVDSIQEFCGYRLNQSELEFIKEAIAGYGVACLMDSAVAEEATEAACDD